MRTRRLGAALALCGAAAALAYWALPPRRPPAPIAPGFEDPRPGPAPAPSGSAAAAPAPLPSSLAGTEPDGGLPVDAEGRFVVTPDVLDFFDYYLSATGEEPLERIVERIRRAIRARLDDPAPALALLERHLAYREEVRRLVGTEGLDALPLERRLQRLREIRRGVFGAADAERLFGEEEARAREAIERRRIALDPSLEEGERAERLAALDADLPPEVRDRRERATVARRVLEQERRLREEGASDAELFAARADRFGEAAAERLAALDRRRAAWDARVETYRAERDALWPDGPPRDPEERARLETLRARHFEGVERARIRALDAGWAGAGAGSP